jgi:hypothetical protein
VVISKRRSVAVGGDGAGDAGGAQAAPSPVVL